MFEDRYRPEGDLLLTPQNRAATATLSSLYTAMERGQILEGTALLCDADCNLTVSLGSFLGRIPREEAALDLGCGTREIAVISRVGKPVCCRILSISEEADGTPRILLTRRRVQQEAKEAAMALSPGQILPVTVTHLEPFGAFVDLACGVNSMIAVENISISRIPHPKARFSPGQRIRALVLGSDPEQGRILLSHKELLGTWAENASLFRPGDTVPGILRSRKEYGSFVELTPNLSGLAEQTEDLAEGQRVSVYIKSILPERMKLKLLVIDRLPDAPAPPLRYWRDHGRLTSFHYAPDGCLKPGFAREFIPS